MVVQQCECFTRDIAHSYKQKVYGRKKIGVGQAIVDKTAIVDRFEFAFPFHFFIFLYDSSTHGDDTRLKRAGTQIVRV